MMISAICCLVFRKSNSKSYSFSSGKCPDTQLPSYKAPNYRIDWANENIIEVLPTFSFISCHIIDSFSWR